MADAILLSNKSLVWDEAGESNSGDFDRRVFRGLNANEAPGFVLRGDWDDRSEVIQMRNHSSLNEWQSEGIIDDGSEYHTQCEWMKSLMGFARVPAFTTVRLLVFGGEQAKFDWRGNDLASDRRHS